MFHTITGKNIIKDIKTAIYGSFLVNQNLYFLDKTRNKAAHTGSRTPLYLESIAKPVQMPSKYQNLPLDVSITLIKANNDKSQKSAKGESGTATTAPRKENTGITFNSRVFLHIYKKSNLIKRKLKLLGT